MAASKKIPLVKPSLPLLEEVADDVSAILSSGQLTNFGSYSRALEEALSQYLGVKHALCVSNASTGLTLLFSVLPKGSEVLVPSFTFLPTVMALLWNDLVPVFVDIDETYNLSPCRIQEAITERTTAIVGVHAFGNPCRATDLEALARKHQLKVFFDGAHAFGASIGNRHVGTFGHAEVFSFSATKLLPCGEGGAICTNDEALHREMLDRRNYGFAWKSHDCRNLGTNAKMGEFNAILGLWGLAEATNGSRRIDAHVAERNALADQYRDRLAHVAGLSFQTILPGYRSTFKDFTLLVEPETFGCDRDDVKKALNRKGIESASYFSPAIHRMKFFRDNRISQHSILPETDRVQRRILSLPIYPGLSPEELACVTETVLSARIRAGGE